MRLKINILRKLWKVSFSNAFFIVELKTCRLLGVSNTELRLKVEVQTLVGTLVLNIPPPPSDRVWISFRPIPKLQLTALPIVGERNITFIRATSWIERKLLDEFQVCFVYYFNDFYEMKPVSFQKLLVLPNMEDITVPIMCSKLPA